MAVVYNTNIDQGADWFINFYYKQPDGTPVNVAGYTAALQIRTSPLAKTAVLTLTSGVGGGIEITDAEGLFACHATAEQTTLITNGKYAYDIEITAPVTGVVTRLCEGTVQVIAQVTRT